MVRKGDYVEGRLPLKKKIYRGWISGYTGDRIYISDFDWNQSPSFSVDNIKLLEEGDFIKIEKEKVRNIKTDKTIQKGIVDAW